jgi:preprotein translocase subunit Sss1
MMLEMLVDGPVQTKALAFAFSVASESEKDTRRIRRLTRRITSGKSTFKKELEKAGISAPNANDSVKILPALMEHIGLITRKAGITRLTPFGRTLLDRQARQKRGLAPLATPQKSQKEPWFRIISPEDDLTVKWKPSDVEDGDIEYDPEDVLERAKLLKERTNIHQATLNKLRRLLEKKWRLGKGNFDLLAERGKVALLTEVKSIKSGSTKDERLRIIDGVGKLFFYETVDVPRLLKNRKANIQKVMLFSRKPNRKEHITFLKRLGIWVLWLGVNGDVQGEKASKKALMVLMK